MADRLCRRARHALAIKALPQVAVLVLHTGGSDLVE